MRMTGRLGTAMAGTALLLATTGSPAAVRQVGPAGFTVRHEAVLTAPPAKVYEALLAVGTWWNPQHSYSKDSRNLSIDPRPGGCFCERLKDGGGVEHLRVVFAQPGAFLRMTGGLGPLQGSGVSGSLTVAVKAAEAGTKLELTYDVGGHLEMGFEKMAPMVDGMLQDQVERLRSLVDTGSPVPVAGAKPGEPAR